MTFAEKSSASNQSHWLSHSLTKDRVWDYLIQKTKNKTYHPPVYEIELLKEFFPYYQNIMSEQDSLGMFKMHFLLYHFLYQLKFEKIKEPYHLHLHLSSIYFQAYPNPPYCPHFDETKLCFCLLEKKEEAKFCELHTNEMNSISQSRPLTSSPLDNYYLNAENIESMTREDLEYMLNTWKAICVNPDKIASCYAELQLEPGTELQKVTQAYHRLAKLYHPDVNPFPEAKEKMHSLNKAYQTIKESILLARDNKTL